jgi:hypothetical protein
LLALPVGRDVKNLLAAAPNNEKLTKKPFFDNSLLPAFAGFIYGCAAPCAARRAFIAAGSHPMGISDEGG